MRQALNPWDRFRTKNISGDGKTKVNRSLQLMGSTLQSPFRCRRSYIAIETHHKAHKAGFIHLLVPQLQSKGISKDC